MLLGVDVGGTFTDAVLAFDGRLITAKVPSTPRDQSQGVIAAVAAALHRAGRPAEEIAEFSHGMTVATNALLEGRAARTALIATEGFTDIVELARQRRPELYRMCAARPAPLVPADLRFGARERMTPDGALVALPPDEPARLTARASEAGAESVAVVLLHSYRHPEHELEIADALRAELPDVHVSLSHDVVGTFREYERAATTEIDAALSPLLATYLERMRARAAELGAPEPAIMQSNGGLIDLAAAATHAAWMVLSGPAGGAAGAAFVARAADRPRALCFDMGGTSCDVCVVDDGAVREVGAGEIAGRPIALPMLAVHTVGAGGGSIAWRDPGGALRVGPRSAGADPGPACYGRGGTQPTVTDANLLLGRLPRRLAGGVELDPDAAERVLGGLDPEAVVRVVDAEMLRALRVVSIERGHDPRDFVLVAFGGAGPLHACALADELGIRTVLVPDAAGVLSALGLVASDERRDRVESRLVPLADAGELPPDGEVDLRYRGQSFELTVPIQDDLANAFHRAHDERYGYADPARPIELVAVRTAEVRRGPALELPPAAPLRAAGPSVLELPGATAYFPPGWVGVRDGSSTLVVTRA